jgi:trans-aconitate methyltransferase
MPSDMQTGPMDFSRRAQPSELPEWMDEPCSYEDFRACLRDLKQVNRIVRTYPPTLRWLRQFTDEKDAPLHIVDVGSGGGDMLRRIEAWARSNKIAVKLTGIDLNPYAARVAREFGPESSAIEWITGNAFSYEPAVPIDIVLSSLFTHHLPDDEIVRFVAWMERVSVRGWFINDLHRERVPYHGFHALAWAMRWHRFVRHDGPISIRRSFSHDDWQRYTAAAGLHPTDVSIDAVWPARLCVGRVK